MATVVWMSQYSLSSEKIRAIHGSVTLLPQLQKRAGASRVAMPLWFQCGGDDPEDSIMGLLEACLHDIGLGWRAEMIDPQAWSQHWFTKLLCPFQPALLKWAAFLSVRNAPGLMTAQLAELQCG